ncbi:MAG TPA: SRPBCC domain-containing protein [Candidatus Limnocylindria bacterium]|jgi:uncharacterized protein YndB with AHSA1/START domain|nr:SRPBCC domain-containing protein [Candidatus Limnocylindria bacterium]
MGISQDIHMELMLPCAVADAWRAIADQKALSGWFMDNDFQPRLHHKFLFRKPPQRGWDGLTHCEVIELEPPFRLAFTYRGKATGEKVLACAGVESETTLSSGKGLFAELDTILRFELSPARSSAGVEFTRLTLTHSGFKGWKMVLVSLVMAAGWRKILRHRLIAFIENTGRTA